MTLCLPHQIHGIRTKRVQSWRSHRGACFAGRCDGPFLGVIIDGSLAAAHSSTSQYVTTSDLQAAAFGAAVLFLILVQFTMYAASQHFVNKQSTSAKAI